MTEKKIITELENIRQKTLTRLVFLYIGSILLFFILAFFLSGGGYAFPIIPFMLFVFAIILGVIHVMIVSNYRKTYKRKLIPIAIKQFGENINFFNYGISKQAAEKTGMFGHFTVYKSEDLITGSIDGVNFSSADVKLGYYTGGKNPRYVSVCHGQLYIFDFNKTFRSKTILREKLIYKSAGLEKIKVESKYFNDKFHIYSNNPHDVFYILTPHFMENILLIEQNYPGNIFISFYENQLYLAVDNRKDLFEPPLLSEVNQEEIELIIKNFNIIKDIIISLKLNDDLFKIK